MIKIYKKNKRYTFSIYLFGVLLLIINFNNSNSMHYWELGGGLNASNDVCSDDKKEDIEIAKMSIKQKNIALCKATFHDNKKRVEMLIKAGADINHYDDKNTTPLILAVRRQNKEITKLLLDSKANPNIYIRGGSAFLHAATENNLLLIQLLYENNADIHRTSIIGETPLMLAVSNPFVANKKTVALLLDLGSDLDTITPDGRTALIIARENAKVIAREFARIIWLLEQRKKSAHKRQKAAAKKIIDANQYIPLDIAGIIAEYYAAKFSEDPETNPENVQHVVSQPEPPKNSSSSSSLSSISSSSKCLIM